MKPIVLSNNRTCIGCNKCTRVCPVALANVVTQDSSDVIRVTIDQTKCIACGACINVCNHGARSYCDDLRSFLKDLEAGKEISLIASPTVKTNFLQWRKLFAWLKSLGVKEIYDGAIGMGLFAWANVTYIKRYRPFSFITTHCPVVISYCKTYRPELFNRLSRLYGPITCLGIYLKQNLSPGHALGALSPCIAATREFSQNNVINYNITFQKLHEYIQKNGIDLNAYSEEDFKEGAEAGQNDSVPIYPTLKENIRFNLDSNLRIDAASGRDIFRLLDDYGKMDVSLLPPIFDVLYCRNGCDLGTAANPDNNYFQTHSLLNNIRQNLSLKSSEDFWGRLSAEFDTNMDLEKLLRDYTSETLPTRHITQEELEKAFKLLGKNMEETRHFDCGFCGSTTCREMAHKIALKTNIPLNCVTKMRQVTEDTNKKITAYIELIHNISEYLLSTLEEDFSASIEHALMSICYAMDGSSTSLWKNTYDKEERPQCHRLVSFPGMLLNHHFNTVTMEDPPGWLDNLVEGNSITKTKSDMTPTEQQKFLGFNINTLVISPIIAQGDFWGFISLLKEDDTNLTEQDLSVLSVCSNILASFIIKSDILNDFDEFETPAL
ncbi:MAG: 4Fe-4S dicluster domain-containing protein [Deltaproteobacteria bacterium]|jgi:ferredoxin|nr:4Fe-4S dicluster domain-containing protein [Deltaproteobacteria bacterium]